MAVGLLAVPETTLLGRARLTRGMVQIGAYRRDRTSEAAQEMWVASSNSEVSTPTWG